MMKHAMLAEPVLVGRERELEELTRHLDSAAQERGTTVFISGEAGSGKTRLTREFLDAAKKRGVAVLAGWCLSDAAVPYFPFVEAFNAEDACKLLDVGFEYITGEYNDGGKIFRKRK